MPEKRIRRHNTKKVQQIMIEDMKNAKVLKKKNKRSKTNCIDDIGFLLKTTSLSFIISDNKRSLGRSVRDIVTRNSCSFKSDEKWTPKRTRLSLTCLKWGRSFDKIFTGSL